LDSQSAESILRDTIGDIGIDVPHRRFCFLDRAVWAILITILLLQDFLQTQADALYQWWMLYHSGLTTAK
jgi:hypothetical protein